MSSRTLATPARAGLAASLLATSLLGHAPVAKADPPPMTEIDAIPGGYYDFGEIREREPDDGDQKILIGSILTPLGILRSGAAVAMVMTAAPARCRERYGLRATDETCRGIRIYSWLGISHGGLMAATGVVLLAWGLTQRARHQAWKRKNNLAIAPRIHRDGAGLVVGFRF